VTIYFGKKGPDSPQRMRGTRTVPDRMIDRFEKLCIGELWVEINDTEGYRWDNAGFFS